MVLKVLLLNFPKEDVLNVPSNIEITEATIEQDLTLHDFHCIIMATDEVLKRRWWPQDSAGRVSTKVFSTFNILNYEKQVKEQIETGGITFCFATWKQEQQLHVRDGYPKISNYFICPIDLGVVNETGDTFYPKFEELGYFTPLLKRIPLREVEWSCYFSETLINARVLGVNRAGYSVFMEVPLGAGKLVMLPKFKNRAEAVTTIVNEIIPQMIHEEEITFVPQWLPDFSSPFEKQIRGDLNEIEKVKRLLFTKDKALEKAVAFAFKKLGFKVKPLPDGTLPDLRIADGKQKGIVEVKGHEKRQATRREVLQLIGYLSETDVEEKGVVVCNHEFKKEPNKRSEEAFTNGAIQLGEKNDVSLVSSVNLYEVVMKILEKKLNDEAMQKFRDKIMVGRGLVQLS